MTSEAVDNGVIRARVGTLAPQLLQGGNTDRPPVKSPDRKRTAYHCEQTETRRIQTLQLETAAVPASTHQLHLNISTSVFFTHRPARNAELQRETSDLPKQLPVLLALCSRTLEAPTH